MVDATIESFEASVSDGTLSFTVEIGKPADVPGRIRVNVWPEDGAVLYRDFLPTNAGTNPTVSESVEYTRGDGRITCELVQVYYGRDDPLSTLDEVTVSVETEAALSSIDDHDPDTQTDSRVYVNGVRIPVGDVDLYMRKEGPLDVTRYVEGEFPSPWDGVDYVDAFGTADPANQTNFDTLRVDVLDHATDTYVLAFRGLVTGVGNTATGPEKMWQFRAQGAGHVLGNIRASDQFTNATAKGVLDYVAEKLDSRLPFSVSTNVTEDITAIDANVSDQGILRDTFSIPDSPLDLLVPAEGVVAEYTDLLTTPKTFQANKDTLADVVSWLAGKTGTVVWLEPTQDGVAFVGTTKPTTRTHVAHYLGGNLYVENNDALSELEPANTLVLRGQGKQSREDSGLFSMLSPADEFVKAKVRHPTLYERAGRTELYAGVDKLSDGQSKQEVIAEAKRLLKRQIDGATSGDMQTLLRGNVRPFDVVKAQPTCNEQYQASAEPLTYEVSRVHHKIRPGLSETELNVGLHTPLDEITVVDSWVKDL